MAPQDYTRRSWQAAVALIAVLTAVAFIPPQTICGVALRRANILSDLITFNDRQAENNDLLPALDDEFTSDFNRVVDRLEAGEALTGPAATIPAITTAPVAGTAVPPDDSLRNAPQITFEWSPVEPLPADAPSADTARLLNTFTPIENFDTLPDGAFRRFCRRLAEPQGGRPVRIAVLGDSFIEGDILTADLREQLQLRYGGRGCGFAPMASPLTGYRRTVRTRSTEWTAYNLMQRRTTPESLRGDYYVSGWLCRPANGAAVRWEGSDFRRRIDRCGTARLLFISRDTSLLTLTLNDSLQRRFEIPASNQVRQIVVKAPISSLALRIDRGAEGFTGYGAQFEDVQGVTIDNYSIRSNNGQAIFGTNPSIDAQIAAMTPYDLIILQYGLNIMQEGVTNYSAYASRIEKLIVFVRECFPDAAILVLSTSDRSVKSEKGFAPMASAPAMVGWQRRAAQNTGAAFWSTYDAMRAAGGMERFVANGWAGKDYTHINYGGGRQVAFALVDAINACVNEARQEQLQVEQPEPVLDSLAIQALDRSMRTGPSMQTGRPLTEPFTAPR